MRAQRYGDLQRLEEAYWLTHRDCFLVPCTARKPNADEQEEDAGDDEAATFA